jgi:hypothetical protein
MANSWKVKGTLGTTNLLRQERASGIRAFEMVFLALRTVAKIK